jgi:hypothetical protein
MWIWWIIHRWLSLIKPSSQCTMNITGTPRSLHSIMFLFSIVLLKCRLTEIRWANFNGKLEEIKYFLSFHFSHIKCLSKLKSAAIYNYNDLKSLAASPQLFTVPPLGCILMIRVESLQNCAYNQTFSNDCPSKWYYNCHKTFHELQ